MGNIVCCDGTNCYNNSCLECETHLKKIKAEPAAKCKGFIPKPLFNRSVQIAAVTIIQKPFPERFQNQQKLLIQPAMGQRRLF